MKTNPLVFVFASVIACVSANAGQLLNQPVDLSVDFANADNTFYVTDRLASFDPATHTGTVVYRRTRRTSNMLFNHQVFSYQDIRANEFPEKVYAADPELPFALEFVNATTFRLRMRSSSTPTPTRASLMLVSEPKDNGSWQGGKIEGGYRYTSSAGSVTLIEKPWRMDVRDAAGRLLVSSDSTRGEPPFCFVRRAADYSRSFAAVFSLAPGERIFGCGESFTGLDKRGQKFPLSTTDALGTEGPREYKPVPFFLSSRGYGMFVHTSSPMTVDFGATNAARTVLTVGEEDLDLFVFLGEPKQVLGAYTELTGRAIMPPLWSFGLWMSRITYSSEAQARDVAAKLRENRLPSDVIHLDTGWFQNDWECDYRFADRFDDPAKMIRDFKDQGFHISLWQLPYFIPRNPLFREIVERGLAVKSPSGGLPGEDAVLDFSNPETVRWYQEKLAGLLRLGVGAIKTDFGEAAPYNGIYASGTTGFYEHNLYPLRYQQAAADITRQVSGDTIIWARAGWAGAQRNAVHWGGDSGKTFSAMSATLRGGLSLGLSGYSFWSHDIGGFGGRNNLDVYRNWVPFGMLTSHARVHGEPPKEPWLLGQEFMDDFRRSDEMRYRLMPYLYAQAKDCSMRGLPMVRALFVEYPNDPGAWAVEDAYLFGTSMLVAPLFEAKAKSRDVYLPGGTWIDYQTGKVYSAGWHTLESGPIPAVILVRDGTIVPRVALAQSTRDIDWTKIEYAVFASEATSTAEGLLCLPADQKLVRLSVRREGTSFVPTGAAMSGVTATVLVNAAP